MSRWRPQQQLPALTLVAIERHDCLVSGWAEYSHIHIRVQVFSQIHIRGVLKDMNEQIPVVRVTDYS